jgi:uncharacterized protein YjiS (DUF1127 family)
MSCTHHTQATYSDFTPNLSSMVHALYCAAHRTVHGWLERRRLLAELQALDPRELRDLHLQRGDFERVVRRRRRRPF